jgi:hypothetical protein
MYTKNDFNPREGIKTAPIYVHIHEYLYVTHDGILYI